MASACHSPGTTATPNCWAGLEGWERTGRAVGHVGITGGYEWWGLAAALSETVGGLLFAAGMFFRPVCLAMLGVMVFATIEQFNRAMPAPEHALKNAFVFAGMFLVGPGRYTLLGSRQGQRPKVKGKRHMSKVKCLACRLLNHPLT